MGEHIRRGKDRVFNTILENTGMPLDVVNGPNSKGGTSTDGNSGRRFFSEELVSSLKECTNKKYHKNLLRLHLLLSSILRVVSSQKQIHVNKFKEYAMEASLLITRSYSWSNINYTLHGVIHHAAELIALNDGYGLGSLSEEGLEAANKHIRRFLETHSRKTSPEEQMVDVMNRLLERSHPNVTDTKIKLKKLKKIRSLDPKEDRPLSEYDSMVEEMFLD